ncbi:beta-1,3-galactosyltransferase 2-like [Scomber scombrus]|uniref:beta-1,3-galactosyltransferase 2-like n=1 Tax=Scomber scombrus TaxID=13677 RepID=UPI002DD8C90C|nr:beta-1,3-galactosyltransferase 2-like [Scomber scombrus]
MPDIGFGKRRQSLSEQLLPAPNQTLKPADSKKRCRCQCFFFILVMTVVLFFSNTNLKEIANDFMKHNTTTKWLNSFKSQSSNYVSPSVSDSRRSTPTPELTSGFTNKEISNDVLQSENITLKISRKINNTIVTNETDSVVIQQETVKPYVSPGPYYVEYPYKYHYIINEPKKCEEQKPFLVLMVPVAPHNVEHRKIVRSTWGGESNIEGKTVKLFFLLGMHNGVGVQAQVLQESIEHHDLIQSNFVDCYKNLTIKTMVMLEWLDSYCSGASYAMKVDSDTFVNLPLLIRMLRNAPKEHYLTGLVTQNAQVLRDPTSKWFMPWSVYPDQHYPTYALGLGYVLSLDLPRKLIEASRDIKALYIEDVYLGLCMKKLNISPTNPPKWNYFNSDRYLHYNRCIFSKLIVCLTTEHADRLWLWKDYKKPGPYC